jgi:hypothetical protein
MTEAVEAIAQEIDDRAELLEDIERSAGDRATTYSRGSRAFAMAREDGFEFLVGEVIAGAALRTPDTLISERGADWVRFSPAEVDEPALDRALAWFDAAWRRAGG